MEREAKIRAILDAISIGAVTAKSLEPSRRGVTIGRIKSGKPVKDSTIDKLYLRLQKLLDGKEIDVTSPEPTKNPRREVKSIAKSRKSIDIEKNAIAIEKNAIAIVPKQTDKELVNRIDVLEAENKKLRERLEAIETSIATSVPSHQNSIAKGLYPYEFYSADLQNSITNSIANEEIPNNVLGFSLVKDKGGRWCGTARINGKQISVYVGRDKGKAEEKIKARLARYEAEKSAAGVIDEDHFK